MAKSLSSNQPTSTVTKTVTIPVPNWSSDYRVKADKAGDCELVCISTPLDAPSAVILKGSITPNVYKSVGSTIPGNYKAGTITGTKTLCQRNEIWTITDSEDATYKVEYPVTARLSIDVPNEALIDEEAVFGIINRMYGQLFEVGSDGTAKSRIPAMLRQALMPTGM